MSGGCKAPVGALRAKTAVASARSLALHASDERYLISTPDGVLVGSLRGSATAVVLIVPGSGPTNRDGNGAGLHPDTYRLLADGLQTQGVATLRFDKRGIGASAGAMRSEADLRFETYVDDVTTIVCALRAARRFEPVIVAGHSEGSLIGMLAAQRSHVDGFVSLCGAAYPAVAELRRQLTPKLAGIPELAEANERILTSLAAGRTVADVPQALMSLYRPSVQPYLISWLHVDPCVEIAKLSVGGVTVVGGTADLQVPVADARALAAACPQAKLTIVDGMSHVLKTAAGMSEQQQAATVYADPALPIVPQVVDAIAAVALAKG